MIKTRRARQIMITQHTRTYTNIQAIYFGCLASIYRETTKNIDSTNQSGLRRRSPSFLSGHVSWSTNQKTHLSVDGKFRSHRKIFSNYGKHRVVIFLNTIYIDRSWYKILYRSLCNTKYSYTHFATLTVSKITTISISIILFIFYYLQIIENK